MMIRKKKNHKNIIKCPDCGFEFEHELTTIDRPLKALTCPNCNKPIEIKKKNEKDR